MTDVVNDHDNDDGFTPVTYKATNTATRKGGKKNRKPKYRERTLEEKLAQRLVALERSKYLDECTRELSLYSRVLPPSCESLTPERDRTREGIDRESFNIIIVVPTAQVRRVPRVGQRVGFDKSTRPVPPPRRALDRIETLCEFLFSLSLSLLLFFW